MKQLGILATLVLAVMIFTSCEENESKPSKKELLSGKNWKVTAWTVTPAYEGTTNVYAILPSCTKDDLTKFDKNGSVTSDEGGSKCDPDDDQIATGTWSFNTDETIVSVTYKGETVNYKILDLTSSSVKIEYEEVEDGVKYTSTKTCKAQ
jgi:hypothetical protein